MLLLGTGHAQIEEVDLIEAVEMPDLVQRQVPNIVVILADDAAFTDFGVYGGEIATPTFDALAEQGIQFTNFHTSPLGPPSRAMLLTGRDSHTVGFASVPAIAPEELEDEPGYRGHFEGRVTTVAQRLSDAGYRTYIAGKWSLGGEVGDLPPAHGFDRSFVVNTGGDHFSERAQEPMQGKPEWIEDGEAVSIPRDFYSSHDLVDRMMGFIDDDIDQESPFFVYLSFLAPSYPLQAPEENIAPYLDRYAEGWVALRQERWRRAQELGVVPADAPLANFVPAGRDWADLTEAEQDHAAKRMAVYAGMIDSLDENIGRFVDYLKETGQFENTIFVLASDNGPESGVDEADGMFRLWARLNGYSFGTRQLGRPGTFATMGPEWASAAASPNNLFKGYTSEGGTRVPLIIAGPGVTPGVRSEAFSFVTDIAPTILDLANAPFERDAMDGRSLTPILLGAEDRVYADLDAVGLELAGNAALFRGPYKIVRNRPPGSDGEWRLFNIIEDPGETRDLSFAKPALFQDMLSDYALYERRVGVRPLPEDYDPQAIIHERVQSQILSTVWWIPVALLLLVVMLSYAFWKFVVRGIVTNLFTSQAN